MSQRISACMRGLVSRLYQEATVSKCRRRAGPDATDRARIDCFIIVQTSKRAEVRDGVEWTEASELLVCFIFITDGPQP